MNNDIKLTKVGIAKLLNTPMVMHTLKNKIYTLACNNIKNHDDEQITYLIDNENKTYLQFYTDGYDGLNADELKVILNFLGIKYFECIYTKFPEKYYKEYKQLN